MTSFYSRDMQIMDSDLVFVKFVYKQMFEQIGQCNRLIL